MSHSERAELPEGFAGIVRVFPLPNLVLFPHAVQALHIFEPRYLQLLEDALAGDQLITMALLQPGWEADYEGRPPIYPVACVGRIMAHARLENGRYNILLQGLKRASVLRELPTPQAFRLAEVALLDDVYPAGSAAQRGKMQRELLRSFRTLAAHSPAVQEQLDELLTQQIPLGVLTDVVAHALPLRLLFKQQLLAEWNVDLRAGKLLEHARTLATNERPQGETPFPPEFSSN